VRTVRIVNVLEESTKFAFLLRDRGDYLVDRHFDRKESAEQLSKRLNQRQI
jgi:arsenic resistance protein ArsH